MRYAPAYASALVVARAVERLERVHGVRITPIGERYAIERAGGTRRYAAYRAASAAKAQRAVELGVKRMESKQEIRELITELKAHAMATARLTPADLIAAMEREAITAGSSRDRISALNILLEAAGIKRQVHEHHQARQDPAALLEQARALLGTEVADAFAQSMGLGQGQGPKSATAATHADHGAGASAQTGSAEAEAMHEAEGAGLAGDDGSQRGAGGAGLARAVPGGSAPQPGPVPH